MKRALLLLALAGCVQSLPVGAERPPRESDLAVIDAVSQAWRAAGNPWTAQCRQERRDRIVVVRSDHVSVYCAARGPCCGSAEKRAACGCGYGCAAGATTWEADAWQPYAGLAQHWRPVLWLSKYDDAQTQERALAHEAGHWILGCAIDDPDRLHKRADMWGAGGFIHAAD